MLLDMQDNLLESAMSVLEHFVVLMYERTSEIASVNEAQKWLFTTKSRNLENIPPTQGALKEHIKRACYQGNCLNKALVSNPIYPDPVLKLGIT